VSKELLILCGWPRGPSRDTHQVDDASSFTPGSAPSSLYVPHSHPLAKSPPSTSTRRTARANCEEVPLRNVTSQRHTQEGVATSDASPQGDIRRQDLANTWTVFDGDKMLLFRTNPVKPVRFRNGCQPRWACQTTRESLHRGVKGDDDEERGGELAREGKRRFPFRDNAGWQRRIRQSG